MINKNIPIIPSFVSQAQLLIPIMNRRLSGYPDKKITISTSLLARKSLIVPTEEADTECIGLEHFISMLDNRIKIELGYRYEILQLRDNICQEFNKLCYEVADEDFNKFIGNQKQKIVNALIDETKIEQKMIAEQFYNDMMNGFDENALEMNQFCKTAYSVLWKPLLTPFPVEAMNKLEDLMRELKTERSTTKIEKMTTQFINYIKESLRAKDIKDKDYNSSEELRMMLEELSKRRGICNIEVSNVTKNESIVEKYTYKCIEEVTLVACTDEFLKIESKLNYDKLKIKWDAEEINVKKFVDKFHKNIKELDLNLFESQIGEEGIKAVSVALKELKYISVLKLNLINNNIGNEGAKALLVALKELKNISVLKLYLGENDIGAEGVNELSATLKAMKNISILDLNFSINNIGSDGAKTVSAALTESKRISSLKLNLEYNDIGMEGAKTLSVALKEMNIITILDLNLQYNNIGEEGAKAVLDALKQLKNISTLDLNLLWNNIGEEAEEALQEFKLIHSDYIILFQI